MRHTPIVGGADAGEAYELLVERLREVAEALAAVDGGAEPLERGDERRRLLREQAQLLSALTDLQRGEQSLN